MDGQDFDAARCVGDFGEELAGLVEVWLAGFAVLEFFEFGAELFLRRDGPSGERVAQTNGHLARTRLGVGEAEDFGGVRARAAIGTRQEQAQNPVGEDFRFAGACRGSDPDGIVRTRGFALLDVGVGFADGVRSRTLNLFLNLLTHAASLSSSPSAAHSAIRARWP